MSNLMTGQPGEYDPELGKLFGMDREQFESIDAARVETEKKLIWQAGNRYQVICQIRDQIKDWADGNIPDDMAEVIEQLEGWYEDLKGVTNQ
ncbi:hypothetical protein [Nocardia phage P3.1]|nr:hypothetical protein [Nocardia phage P3.1]